MFFYWVLATRIRQFNLNRREFKAVRLRKNTCLLFKTPHTLQLAFIGTLAQKVMPILNRNAGKSGLYY